MVPELGMVMLDNPLYPGLSSVHAMSYTKYLYLYHMSPSSLEETVPQRES